MNNVLITGGSGLIGTALAKMLISKGYKVTILTRGKARERNGIRYAHWNPEEEQIDIDSMHSADFVVHLAGAGVADKRWSPSRKKEIVRSRTGSSRMLYNNLRFMGRQVQAVISASAIGWYGPDPSIPNPHPFTEEANSSDDFLGVACKEWEDSVQPVTNLGKRLVILRTGIVLSTAGGALKEFMKPIRFGLATTLGSGEQMVSWIHITDLCRLYLMAIENSSLHGVYNAVSPHPVSNRNLNHELASQMRGRFFLPVRVPAAALKVALGEMSVEVLKSATVSSRKIQEEGFEFQFPSIQVALKDLLKKKH